MTAASTPHRSSAVWRILTTPIGPRLHPTIRPRAPRVVAVVARAELPAELGALAAQTAQRTRLWRRERADIAAELCGHFAGGLDSGRSVGELVEGFGQPRTTARLMRRAKLRARPWPWRALHAAQRTVLITVAAAGVLVAGQVVRFATATPGIRHNYLADLNAPSEAVPEPQRAWPLYREAALGKPRSPHSLDLAWGPLTPEDPRWEAAAEHVRASRDTISLIGRAASRPVFGPVFSDKPDAELLAKRGVVIPADPPEAYPELRNLDSQPFRTMQSLANLLCHRVCLAAAEGSGDVAARGIADLVAMAEHQHQVPILQSQTHALATFGMALDTAGVVMREWPGALNDEQWTGVAHALARFAGGGQVRLRFGGERPFIEDLVQRLYTEGGSFTPAGHKFVREWARQQTYSASAADTVASAIDALLETPSAAEFMTHYDRSLAAAEAEAVLPLYRRQGRELQDPIFEAAKPYVVVWSSTSYPAEWFPAALRRAGLSAEQATQRRDAVLAGIALELFKRRHGAYPATLAELVPAYLPAVPMDRFDGGALKYTMRDGGPLLYTVGANRRDDGGRPAMGPRYEWRERDWVSESFLKATGRMLDGAPAFDGDWILWPVRPALLDTGEQRAPSGNEPAGRAPESSGAMRS